ncbi:Metal-dependent hydrolase, endonuclease/exonuclease/phosphatase family [Flavobacterium sp. 9AF]|uniref:endonuclease/exonuclease/phosphatase family protein n=1 Tax=Flavobacterium sp. 9AF TaxID=2653142 RepID=UPI0012F34D3C|nr:endonuclease/exonuclease/phosphatase family protein [Flavobacterium sp. 9AF]VXB63832.1 Metal-dependent hydrolase, endonuclease/exonuclease/phosphatase family [Flavobacterium sp. 9AF]
MKFFVALFVTLVSHCILAQTEMNVMSYNIRLGSAQDGENNWENRKEKLVALLDYYEADFIGLQEVQKFQLDYITTYLTNYKVIGLPREEGEWAEYSCVLYNEKRFTVEEQHTLWLSETPNKMSKGWDAACHRIVTYGRFKDKKDKKEYWIANTHLDHQGLQAREKSAEMIVSLSNELHQQKAIPFILTGDFNAPKEEKTIAILKENLWDTYEKTVKKPYGPKGTWNAFRFQEEVKNRIDYIFSTKESKLQVKKIAIIDDFYDFKYPSDHLPVLVSFESKK